MLILQNNEYISSLFEQSTMFQLVNTEGLAHRKGWPPTWFGDSRGTWDGDTLVIDVLNFNGYPKLGTIGHPMSDQSHWTVTFKRPDMGHMQFTWILDDPKNYTRPVSNERVFVPSPDVEIMEYVCMENNLAALRDGGVKPWVGSKDQDANLLYGTAHDWPAYDLTKEQELTGVIRELRFRIKHPLVKIEVDKQLLDVILAPALRMEFRGLEENMLKTGGTVSVVAYPSKQIKDEFRAETITVGTRVTESLS